MRKDNIRARLKELIDDLADKMVVTRESLVAEYDQIIAAAHREKQYGAAATAWRPRRRSPATTASGA
ncbi:hypothetical protein CK218_27630 [Mesorhizobium sp. WSM3879]|nr:hypothetical protein CK218_27630 [Mesorhizobium sp. WSM3879]